MQKYCFYYYQEIAESDERMMTQTVKTEVEYFSAVSDAFHKVENELHLFQLYDFLYSMATTDREVIQERQWQVGNQISSLESLIPKDWKQFCENYNTSTKHLLGEILLKNFWPSPFHLEGI